MRTVQLGTDVEFAITSPQGPVPANLFLDVLPTKFLSNVDMDDKTYAAPSIDVYGHDDSLLLELSTKKPLLVVGGTSSFSSRSSIGAAISALGTAVREWMPLANAKLQELFVENEGNTIIQCEPQQLYLEGRFPTVSFTSPFDDTWPGMDVLGCRPDMNVFFGADNNPFQKANPEVAGQIRTLGGHMHFSFNKKEAPPIEFFHLLGALISGFDIELEMQTLGLENVNMSQLTGATIRRVLYGQPGSCRMRDYGKDRWGVEFRSTSTTSLINLNTVGLAARYRVAMATLLCAYVNGFNDWDTYYTQSRISTIRGLLSAMAEISNGVTNMRELWVGKNPNSSIERRQLNSLMIDLVTEFQAISDQVRDLQHEPHLRAVV